MVPDHRHVPQKLFDSGLYNLKTEHGMGAYVDAVVSTLHGLDPRWGHLKKKPGQTAVHGHGEDAALYLSDEPGQSQAVDFVGGAGGPDPRPAWQVDQPRYSESDWLDPTEHGHASTAPPPAKMKSYEELGGDEGAKKITRILDHDYRFAGRPGQDGDSGAWLRRTDYDFMAGIEPTVESSTAKHRDEWLHGLSLISITTSMSTETHTCKICSASVTFEKGSTAPKIPHAADCHTKPLPAAAG